MYTISNPGMLGMIFGASFLLIAYYLLKMARQEKDKKIEMLCVVLVLSGVALICFGIWDLLTWPGPLHLS